MRTLGKLVMVIACIGFASASGELTSGSSTTMTSVSISGDTQKNVSGDIQSSTGDIQKQNLSGDMMTTSEQIVPVVTKAKIVTVKRSQKLRDSESLMYVETQDSIDYLYYSEITKFAKDPAFESTRGLRRDEASAFFTRFADKTMAIKMTELTGDCENITDLNKATRDLVDELKRACSVGLIDLDNQKANPEMAITKGQAAQMLLKVIDFNNVPLRSSQIDLENSTAALKLYGVEKKSYNVETAKESAKLFNKDAIATRGYVSKLIEATSELLMAREALDSNATVYDPSQKVFYDLNVQQ